ncbi:MAG: Na/Pi symporter [Cytophagales bacterium]|nr:Na/Pi symporter [Cytophagales bacterium]
MEDTLNITNNRQTLPTATNVMIIIGSVLVFVFSIQLMGAAFGTLGGAMAESILQATSNPFIGLFIGLLVTAILQSSSTTTSLVVAAVASNSISLQSALPIVMGANIGTTITSTIVSLGYITKTTEFRKAISAGVSHDIFNVLIVLILFPLELKYQFLSSISSDLSAFLKDSTTQQGSNFGGILNVLNPATEFILDLFGSMIGLLLSVILLFGTVKVISKLLYNRLIGSAKKSLEKLMFDTKFKSFGWGLLVTSVIQSSSLTTSLIVPLVATGKVKLNKAFQFILGANLGTTITAIIAALFKSEAAISLALAHFLFNLIGVAIFLLIPALNRIPTFLSDRLGYLTLRSRIIGFTYIILTFFLLPFSLIYFSGDTNLEVKEPSAPEQQLTQEKIQP